MATQNVPVLGCDDTYDCSVTRSRGYVSQYDDICRVMAYRRR